MLHSLHQHSGCLPGDDLDEIIAKAEDAERDDAGGSVLRSTTSALGGFMRFLGALSR